MFWRNRKKQSDLLANFAAVVDGGAKMASNLAACAGPNGVSLDQIARVEDFFCSLIRENVASGGKLSPAEMEIAWPLVEHRFRKAFHENLVTVCPITSLDARGSA